jgi:hypothetical protein
MEHGTLGELARKVDNWLVVGFEEQPGVILPGRSTLFELDFTYNRTTIARG